MPHIPLSLGGAVPVPAGALPPPLLGHLVTATDIGAGKVSVSRLTFIEAATGFWLGLSGAWAVCAEAVNNPDDEEVLMFCGAWKVLQDGACKGGCEGW